MNIFYSLAARSWGGLVIAVLVAGLGGLVARVAAVQNLSWAPFVAYALFAIALLLAAGSLVAIVRRAIVRRNFPPMGKLVDVGGYRMHILAEGTAGALPTVVWIPGGHGLGLSFYNLHKRIRGEARSILFDRPGTGWSDVGPFPRSTAREADELAKLLDGAGESGPFLLVGHSYGGLLAANFARRNPDRTAAVVLLDATPPDSMMYTPVRAGNAAAGLVLLYQLPGLAGTFGIPFDPVAMMIRKNPALSRLMDTIKSELADVQAAREALEANPANAWTSASIFGEFGVGRLLRSAPELMVYDGELGDLPVTVVIPQDDMNEAIEKLVKDESARTRVLNFMRQTRLRYLRASTRSQVIHAPDGTGHNFPYEAPDFVMGIVRRALANTTNPAATAAGSGTP